MQAAVDTLTLVDQEAPPAHPLTVAPSGAVTPSEILRLAVQSGAGIDQLERLMALQERHEQAQERERKRLAEQAFWRDFAGFRGENVVIPRTLEVDRGRGGSFMQAEYHVVMGMLSVALSRHGFGIRHDVKFGSRLWTTDGVASDIPWVYVTCFLTHRDGHIETLDLEGPPGDLSANWAVQNMQVTASFLKRQSALAITGTPTGGEDDENQMRGSKVATRGPASGKGGGDDEAVDALVQIGKDKAMEGMTVLTDWWASLTQQQREKAMPHFKSMRDAAGNADKKGRK